MNLPAIDTSAAEHAAAMDRLGDEIAELSAHLDAATARLLELIRAFDAQAGWSSGFRSCAEWLAWRTGVEPGTAREHVRVARALGGLPRIAEALARGELSYARVRAITRVATPDTEERLLAVARAGTAAHVERIVRAWRRVDRLAEAREARRQHRGRALHVYQDEDGMVVVRGRLTPEAGAVLMQALAAARETLYRTRLTAGAGVNAQRTSGRSPSQPGDPVGTPIETPPTVCCRQNSVSGDVTGPGASHPGEWRDGAGAREPETGTPAGEPAAGDVQLYDPTAGGVRLSDPASETPTMAQQQADALALLAEAALHHGLDPGAPGERYQVVVHVDAPALADPDQPGQSVLEDTGRVSSETSRRLACDASRVVMRHDPDGRVTEIGARTRTIPPALRRALSHRDHGCRFPGCDLRVTQGHHIRHWAAGGPTTLSNLVLLCRRHHRAVHEEGYRLERGADGTLRFRRPDGRALPDVPPRPAPPDDPVRALRARHAAVGLEIGPRTGLPGWLGERLDVVWAIDVLHPLAAQPGGGAQTVTA